MAPPEFHTFLFTSVIANNGGTVECVDVNVGKYPIKVTATFFDGAGIAVGTSGEQTLTPGGTGGFSIPSHDGYCRFIVDGP
jgi:hypothetical protein